MIEVTKIQNLYFNQPQLMPLEKIRFIRTNEFSSFLKDLVG